MRSHPGTPSSTLGPRRIGGDRIVPLSKTLRNAKSGNTSKLASSAHYSRTPMVLNKEVKTDLIEGGRTIGSRCMFLSTSSINPTFHRSR